LNDTSTVVTGLQTYIGCSNTTTVQTEYSLDEINSACLLRSKPIMWTRNRLWPPVMLICVHDVKQRWRHYGVQPMQSYNYYRAKQQTCAIGI